MYRNFYDEVEKLGVKIADIVTLLSPCLEDVKNTSNLFEKVIFFVNRISDRLSLTSYLQLGTIILFVGGHLLPLSIKTPMYRGFMES